MCWPSRSRMPRAPADIAGINGKKQLLLRRERDNIPFSSFILCPKGVIRLPGVFLNEDEYNFDFALRRFNKQVEKAGILSEMKKRQHYEKPSVMRKKKKAAARKRLMKKIRKLNMG